MCLHHELCLLDRVAENELRHSHVGIGRRLVEQSADFLVAADVQARVFGKAGHGHLLKIQALIEVVTELGNHRTLGQYHEARRSLDDPKETFVVLFALRQVSERSRP